jgi:mannosyltransferase OCH1-like enzyme
MDNEKMLPIIAISLVLIVIVVLIIVGSLASNNTNTTNNTNIINNTNKATVNIQGEITAKNDKDNQFHTKKLVIDEMSDGQKERVSINQRELSLIIPNDLLNNNIINYAKAWNYGINDLNVKYLFYINEYVDNIDMLQSLNTIMEIAGASNYVVFYGSTNFISKDKNITNLGLLKQVLDEDITIDIEEIMYENFPYRTINGIILPEKYFNAVFRNEHVYLDDHVILHSVTKRSQISNVFRKIPETIHQSFETKLVPAGMSDAIKACIDRNPEYEHRYYDCADRRNYIKDNFNDVVLKAYDMLIPGAYKCDLWRLCVIYNEGGIYLDIKNGVIVPFNDYIDNDTDFFFTNDRPDGCIYNAFFGSVPKNPLLLGAIELITYRILNKEYGIDDLSITGPRAIADSIFKALKFSHNPRPATYHINNLKIQVFKHLGHDPESYILTDKDMHVIKTRYNRAVKDTEYIQKITGIKYYTNLWFERRIFH